MGLFFNGRRRPSDPPMVDHPNGMTNLPGADGAAKPSFFGQGGAGRAIAGYLGDALLRMGGAGPIYQPQVQFQQQQFAEQAEQQRRQAAEWSMWQRQQEWKRANPEAPQPTEFERAAVAGGFVPGSPEFVALMRRRAENQASAPPLVITNADGTKTVYPGGMIPQGGAQPQRRVVQQLPPGAKPIGGPTQPASGGFR